MQWKEKTDRTIENPQGIKLAMSKVYKIDKLACLKHNIKLVSSIAHRLRKLGEQLQVKNKNRDTRTYLLISLQTLFLQIDPQTLAVVKRLH